ncbi:S-layer homology domain-containing protein [Aedoeadaptatus coxii]|uniref:S-layer homology domain-containing protein n=1 Tax=Aedoeadaptatus coxii TaxID=755172 RepID=UPI002AD4638E|nr:S-layer homology domain-containing protein [Peptoniphilus coxii]
MNKKFLSLVLALVMVLGTFGNVFAAAAPAKKDEAKKEAKTEAPKLTSTEAKTQWLIDNKIVIGNADADGKANGNMALTDPIRRDHVAKMLVFAMGEQDFAAKLQGVYRPFPDVELTSIVNGFISVAASKTSVNGVPIIAGYEDGTFRPTREVTYAELAKMLVVSIDKDLTPAKVKGMKWYSDWMKRAVELGILDGLSVDNPNAKAVRKDAFAMIYNAFFQLKEVKAVPANEMRGVISERSNGDKIVLNQDKAKVEYKVNDQTIFVNQRGVAQKWLANRNEQNNYYVGSVVRVLADKNGVATHVIEMGNPVVGIQNRATAWVDLGNKTLNMVQSAWNPTAKDVKLNKDSLDVKKVNYEVNGKTEFYVADYDNNILTKVADYATAKKLVADKANMTYNVYLAYEKLPASGVREARVVVFNKANVEANTRLVRVAKAVSNPDYLLQVNAPGERETALESFSTRNNDKVWPYNYNYNAFDVVKLAYSGNNVKGSPVKVIDYEKDNIYKVVDFKLVEGTKVTDNVAREKANQVVLADREGFIKKYDLPKEYNVFFGNQFVKGAHVQIATRDKTDIIDVVSVVQHDLRGHNNGQDTRLVKGVVANFLPANNKNELNRVEIIEEGNMRPTTFVTTLAEGNFVKGSYVEVRVGEVNKTYNYREILEVKKLQLHSSEADKKVAQKLQAVVLDKGVVKGDDANKAALEAVIAEYNTNFGEAPKSTDVNNIKALVNYFIANYNKAQADNSKHLELIK